MTKRRFIGDEIMVSVMKFEVGISICSRNWMNFVKEPGFLGEIYHFRDWKTGENRFFLERERVRGEARFNWWFFCDEIWSGCFKFVQEIEWILWINLQRMKNRGKTEFLERESVGGGRKWGLNGWKMGAWGCRLKEKKISNGRFLCMWFLDFLARRKMCNGRLRTFLA